MALSLETDVEIKSPADKFYKRLSKELHQVPNASDIVHGFEVHEGDFETPGSIKFWTYTIDGKKEEIKEKFEIDEPNMVVSLVAVGGHVLEKYKSYKVTLKVVPMEENATVLKIKLSYEKFQETDPDPDNYMQFVVSVVKDTDAHLVSGQ